MEEAAAASEQRTRRRRLRRIPSLWVRLTALAIFLIAILVGMVGLTLKAVRPYREAGVQARKLTAIRRQIADLDRANASLQRQVLNLNSPGGDGVISAAHKMGYAFPGESLLVIEGAPVPAPDGTLPDLAGTDALPQSSGDGDGSLLHRFWRHLLDL